MVFPVTDGRRSTTATGRAVLADAARAVDPALADGVAAAPAWHRDYVRWARRLVEAELDDPGAPAAVPRAGLASLHERMRFRRAGRSVPPSAALDEPGPDALHTAVVPGRDDVDDTAPGRLTVPYRGQRLTGDALRSRLQAWVDAGTVEPSFAAAIRRVADSPQWLDCSDLTVVVLGAAAEMGPLRPLARWGARLVPVDLPGADRWRGVLEAVRAGPGRALVPTTEPVAADADAPAVGRAAGVDLITAMPEIAAWLAELDGPLVVGNYVYAPGSANVRASMAVDTITAHLTAVRSDVSLAVLATPTDVFAVPAEAVATARRRFAARGTRLPVRLARAATGGRLFRPSFPEAPDGRGVVDAVIPQQGPNYLLAKRLHRWRARAARADGLVSSINVAPPTRTRSVLSSRALAAAYRAAPRFGIETFTPATSRTLMAAALVHDLRHDGAAARPDQPLDHPLDLLTDGAAHGGLWRNPYEPRSVLGLAVLLGFLGM